MSDVVGMRQLSKDKFCVCAEVDYFFQVRTKKKSNCSRMINDRYFLSILDCDSLCNYRDEQFQYRRHIHTACLCHCGRIIKYKESVYAPNTVF